MRMRVTVDKSGPCCCLLLSHYKCNMDRLSESKKTVFCCLFVGFLLLSFSCCCCCCCCAAAAAVLFCFVCLSPPPTHFRPPTQSKLTILVVLHSQHSVSGDLSIWRQVTSHNLGVSLILLTISSKKVPSFGTLFAFIEQHSR